MEMMLERVGLRDRDVGGALGVELDLLRPPVTIPSG
jgi:hypothetical protein